METRRTVVLPRHKDNIWRVQIVWHEWCRALLWKIRLRKRCCRLDRCPFPADDACWRNQPSDCAKRV